MKKKFLFKFSLIDQRAPHSPRGKFSTNISILKEYFFSNFFISFKKDSFLYPSVIKTLPIELLLNY